MFRAEKGPFAKLFQLVKVFQNSAWGYCKTNSKMNESWQGPCNLFLFVPQCHPAGTNGAAN